MYQASEIYLPSDALDIGVNPGDLVGVIQTKDPMGNSKRWFVDNGESQGFLPAHILNPIGKKHALKKYDHFALNTSCFWGNARSNITPVVQFHEIFVTKIMNK